VSVTATLAESVVQDTAFDALNVASMQALVSTRIYSDVPQPPSFPFVWLTFADPSSDAVDTFGQAGAVVHIEVHAYSDYEGDDECADILSKAAELLHHSALAPTGWSVPLVIRDSASIVVEDYNGRAVRHGILRVDVHARKN
jgi:hypothetical protein